MLLNVLIFLNSFFLTLFFQQKFLLNLYYHILDIR